MIELRTVPPTEYTHDPRIINAVENLNAVGLEGIDNSTTVRPGNFYYPPVRIVKPVSRHDEPLSEFQDGVIARYPGAGNGLRLQGQHVLSALVAEVTGLPVVETAFPDRDNEGFLELDVTVGWRSLSDEEKSRRGIVQLDHFARRSVTTIAKILHDEGAYAKLSVTGESLGGAVALAAGHVARRDFDVTSVSAAALPNSERRSLYWDLLITDFSKASDGMKEQVKSEPHLEPFIEAQGYNDDSRSFMSEQLDGLDYVWRDLFGKLPLDIPPKTFRNNRALIRTLTVPTGLKMIERLSHYPAQAVPVSVGFYELDTVARPDAFVKLGVGRCTPDNAKFQLYEKIGHAGCNNPGIIAHRALQTEVNGNGLVQS